VGKVRNPAAFAGFPSGVEKSALWTFPRSGFFHSSPTHKFCYRAQNCNPFGIGIGAENGAGATESVTIENSNTNANIVGIYACSEESPSTLSASIKSNNVTGSEWGIYLPCPGVVGSISGNVINSVVGSAGIYTFSPATVSGNTIIGPESGMGISVHAVTDISNNTIQGDLWGVYLYAAGTITSNHILNSVGYGVFFGSSVTGATVKSNTITNNTITGDPVGIELYCNANTVSGNTINGATIGLDGVPASFTGVNKFYNVPTNTTSFGC
jgi:parallel beta-helix repeat protein